MLICCNDPAMLREESRKWTHAQGARRWDWAREGACVMVGPYRDEPSAAEGSGGDTIRPVRAQGEGRDAIAEGSFVKAATGRSTPIRMREG